METTGIEAPFYGLDWQSRRTSVETHSRNEKSHRHFGRPAGWEG